MISDVFNMDCLEYMRNIPDKFFDLAIADPPYGVGRDGQKETKGKNPKHNRKFFENKGWDKHAPDEEFFSELFRISVNQIIFGANHFISKIPFNSPCWIVWDKGQKGLTMADCELAWTSYTSPGTRTGFAGLWSSGPNSNIGSNWANTGRPTPRLNRRWRPERYDGIRRLRTKQNFFVKFSEKMFGNIKIVLIFVPGLRLQPDGPGRFPEQKKDNENENESKF